MMLNECVVVACLFVMSIFPHFCYLGDDVAGTLMCLVLFILLVVLCVLVLFVMQFCLGWTRIRSLWQTVKHGSRYGGFGGME